LVFYIGHGVMIERSISITTHCVLTKDPYEFTVLNKPVNPYPIE